MNKTKNFICMAAAIASAFLSSACLAFDRKEIEPHLAVLKQEGENRERVADAVKQLRTISDRNEDVASVCINEIRSYLRRASYESGERCLITCRERAWLMRFMQMVAIWNHICCRKSFVARNR